MNIELLECPNCHKKSLVYLDCDKGYEFYHCTNKKCRKHFKFNGISYKEYK